MKETTQQALSNGPRHHPEAFLSDLAPTDTTITERYIVMSDGVALRVIDFQPAAIANKPWLVFLSGWLSTIGGWAAFFREITPHYRVLYIESREKGSSVLPMLCKPQFTVDRMTTDLAEAISELLPIDQTWVLSASSLGSSVCMEYLATQNKNWPKPTSAMLIAPNMTFDFPSWARPIFRWYPASLFPALQWVIKFYIRRFKVDMKNEPAQYRKYADTIDAADPKKLRPNALALMDYDGWPTVPKVQTPTLLLGGATDQMHGLASLQKAASLNPGIDLEEMASNKATHSDKAGRRLRDMLAASADSSKRVS